MKTFLITIKEYLTSSRINVTSNGRDLYLLGTVLKKEKNIWGIFGFQKLHVKEFYQFQKYEDKNLSMIYNILTEEPRHKNKRKKKKTKKNPKPNTFVYVIPGMELRLCIHYASVLPSGEGGKLGRIP